MIQGLTYQEGIFMRNILRNTTHLAMHIVKEYITADSVVVDATCGNGYDTLALARCHPAVLYAFDIQEKAVEATKQRLSANGFDAELKSGRIRVICDNHDAAGQYLTCGIDAAVFNLGYLPGSDKSITTTSSCTVNAVRECLKLLNRNGIISITMYSGHAEGSLEKNAVLDFAAGLDSSEYHVVFTQMLNQPSDPPETLFITRK